MTETTRGATGRVGPSARRLVVFGVTGQLGRELVDQLSESNWRIAELVGVASENSVGETFEFRGEEFDVVGEWPVLKGCDLVFLCTRGVDALEVVRECLRARVPCLDLTGALSAQTEVPLPAMIGRADSEGDAIDSAPLIALPTATTLAWASVLGAIGEAPRITRVVGTVLSSAAAQGRRGLVALSEESIALFNQSESLTPGPAGQGVAFDVVPGGGIDAERVRLELGRIFGETLRVDVAGVQVPAFVGEGSSLVIEFGGALERATLESRLAAHDAITLFGEGLGSHGLAVVEESATEAIGPTLRDAAGTGDVWVGRIEADTSVSVGHGWRLWLAIDPIRLAVDHAIGVAERRLGNA